MTEKTVSLSLVPSSELKRQAMFEKWVLRTIFAPGIKEVGNKGLQRTYNHSLHNS
jgi:hypothetical protein